MRTNGIESVWSLFEGSIIGSYDQVSEKHLQAYLEETGWRFNNRQNPFMFRDTMLALIDSENWPYQELIG